MHPFGTWASLRSALVPKGCNFFAPLTLTQQFLTILIKSHRSSLSICQCTNFFYYFLTGNYRVVQGQLFIVAGFPYVRNFKSGISLERFDLPTYTYLMNKALSKLNACLYQCTTNTVSVSLSADILVFSDLGNVLSVSVSANTDFHISS